MPFSKQKQMIRFKPTIIKSGKEAKILLIYTGGTLGMAKSDRTGALIPVKFDKTLERVPELDFLEPEIHSISFDKPIDSSDVSIEVYLKLVRIIKELYEVYDGFVIIHGTDTMAFTASALSFLIQNPQKPIVFTGAQLPIGIPRTDARENLITSIEIAAAKIDNEAIVPEVCIYFNGRLLRGNRARKRESSQFDAFDSENYPYLAEIGVYIDYNFKQIRYSNAKTRFYEAMSKEVSVLTLFPGISLDIVEQHLNNPHINAIILQTFGSGNAPSNDAFVGAIKQAINSGKHLINITQCTGGKVLMGKYASSRKLMEVGVISGWDMTLEAAIGKLMWILAEDENAIEEIFNQNLAGEVSLA